MFFVKSLFVYSKLQTNAVMCGMNLPNSVDMRFKN